MLETGEGDLASDVLAAGTCRCQRAISAHETVAGNPRTAVVVELASVLEVSSEELPGLKPLRPVRAAPEDPEARRPWKKFQQVPALPEKDRRAVIRLVNSLTAARSAGRG